MLLLALSLLRGLLRVLWRAKDRCWGCPCRSRLSGALLLSKSRRLHLVSEEVSLLVFWLRLVLLINFHGAGVFLRFRGWL